MELVGLIVEPVGLIRFIVPPLTGATTPKDAATKAPRGSSGSFALRPSIRNAASIIRSDEARSNLAVLDAKRYICVFYITRART